MFSLFHFTELFNTFFIKYLVKLAKWNHSPDNGHFLKVNLNKVKHASWVFWSNLKEFHLLQILREGQSTLTWWEQGNDKKKIGINEPIWLHWKPYTSIIYTCTCCIRFSAMVSGFKIISKSLELIWYFCRSFPTDKIGV